MNLKKGQWQVRLCRRISFAGQGGEVVEKERESRSRTRRPFIIAMDQQTGAYVRVGLSNQGMQRFIYPSISIRNTV